jgi:uracil-DNA glycosylase/DNA polymerase I-like protein with 3'-5' exonuclease and polymerase domains
MHLRSGDGPIPAKVMLVGEAWGAEEERKGIPFVGASGLELNRMLQEAGMMRSDIYVSNLVNARPPENELAAWIFDKKAKYWKGRDCPKDFIPFRDTKVAPLFIAGLEHLKQEIAAVKPNLIVGCGGYPLWALTGRKGIMKWRGSHLQLDGADSPKLIPTIHPAAILRQWDQRAIAVSDLRRARRESETRTYDKPSWRFLIRPTFNQTVQTLQALIDRAQTDDLWIELDLETRAGHIACCGLSWSLTEGVSIPFMCVERASGYWSLDEEAHIIWLLFRLLTNPRVKVRWQNGLYDAQYIHRHWHFIPHGVQDTMISQHTLFCQLPKALYFQASMYARHYVYWKDEGKNWDPKMGEEQLWSYNLEDCVYTRECGEAELRSVEKLGLGEVHDFQQRLFYPVLKAMLRGIRVRTEQRDKLIMETQEAIASGQGMLHEVLGHELNIGSYPQMTTLFYRDFAQPAIMTRATKNAPAHVTCNDEALTKIGEREPLLKPLTDAIADLRTLGKFMEMLTKRLDVDNRMRCSYNIGGSTSGKSAPYSYRLSSSENAFGSGANLQNIPSDKSMSVSKAEKRGTKLQLPNIRTMFGPDSGFTFFDLDLDRADLQVVVWEARDSMLQAALRLGVDLHLLNAFVLAGREAPPLEELIERHSREEACSCGPRCYWDYRDRMRGGREFAKRFVHATDYGATARGLAPKLGETVATVERAQALWFGAHPGILAWQRRTEEWVVRHRFVQNPFGYRWYIFDRLEGGLPEWLAWIPQSTVGCAINRAWMNLWEQAPEIEVLLQVHDSLAGQFPSHRHDASIEKLRKLSSITIPYEDPLVIPVGVKTSRISWGDCK